MSLDPRHKETDCSAPFCKDCWQIIKGRLVGVMDVAKELATPQEEKPNDL